MKFVIRGKNGFAFTSTEIGNVGTEVQYDTYEEAEKALEQFEQTMPFLNLDIIAMVPHGGKREGAGRPSLGTTKKVSLTLADEIWDKLAEYQDRSPILNKQSAVLRSLIERHFEPNRYGEETVLVPIKKELLEEIQAAAVHTHEIYDQQDPEDFVNNILVTEMLRLKRKKESVE
jgi:Zn-dependent M32 family carboxypeptidase